MPCEYIEASGRKNINDRSKLKDKYALSWKRAARREKCFECLVENLTPFKAVRVGVGTGSSERLAKYRNGPEQKFDYKLIYSNKVIAYVDITGSDKYPR